MINTIDFITPPVDDPYWFGQISAANSISDIYSMGGSPLTALNVVMFPSKLLEELLFDPQTSGGLLLSVPDARSTELLDALAAAGVQSAVRVGEIMDGSAGITVV
ncbi:MAG: hypothetical protein GY850_26910 [bacterium]|nr:hypothetical protein [bacterium]